MPAYYAMGYLSGVLFRVTTTGEYPHAETPNARCQAREIAGARHERRLFPVACTPLFGAVGHVREHGSSPQPPALAPEQTHGHSR